MRVLGVDPGLRFTGWALITPTESSYILNDYGCITPDPHLSVPARLLHVESALDAVIKKNMPTKIALETIFFAHNPQSILLLAYARAMIMLLSGKHHIVLEEFSPATIKKTLTGRGNAQKEHMTSMISMLFGVNVSHHTADAIALALCGCGQHSP